MEALFALFTFGITEQFFTFQRDVFPCKQNRVYIHSVQKNISLFASQ
jgi:hypothetical protein